MIRTDTDEINQPRIARDSQQLKNAPIARKARVSTAINTVEHKRAYCVGTIEDHGDMVVRRDENREPGYTILHGEFGLQTFAKLKALTTKGWSICRLLAQGSGAPVA